MAAAIQVAGPVEVKVDSSTLGWTANGVEATAEAFFLNVPGDENGGDDGPPIDVQYLGEIARVRVELTKWDETVASPVLSRLSAGSAGTPGTVGTLMFTASKTFSLVLAGTITTYTFPRAFARNNIEVNRGSKFSRLIIEFECHKNADGLLYSSAATV